jgi:hypothetical protein
MRDHGGWRCGRDGLRFGSLLVSFQRFARSGGEVVECAPQSLGALPVGQGKGSFLLPLAEAEGFWIGAMLEESASTRVRLAMQSRDGRQSRLAELVGPQTAVIAGMIRPDGRFDIFSRHSVAALAIAVDDGRARVEVVEPAVYTQVTGQPAPDPLDPAAGYGGWRLP